MSNQKPFFYRDSVQKTLFKVLIGVVLIFSGLEIVIHRHSHFSETGIQSIDGIFGFYILLGLFGALFFVFLSKGLGTLLKADERYYDGDL